MGHELWNLFLSRAIRKTIAEIRSGDREANFEENVRELEPRLTDWQNRTDPVVDAVYSFTENFFFAHYHSDPPVVSVSREQAFARLEAVAERLEQNQPVEDGEVLACYERPGPSRGCWGTLKDMFSRARPG